MADGYRLECERWSTRVFAGKTEKQIPARCAREDDDEVDPRALRARG
jgi:hypothetical protein